MLQNTVLVMLLFFVVICEALELFASGRISYNDSQVNGGYPVDTMANFMCNHGYRKIGSKSSTCQSSGNWNQQTPTCMQSNENGIKKVLEKTIK